MFKNRRKGFTKMVKFIYVALFVFLTHLAELFFNKCSFV